MGYVKKHTRAIRRPWTLRGLGATSALVGSSMIYGSDRVPVSNLRRPTGLPILWPGAGNGPMPPVIIPPQPLPVMWGGNPLAWNPAAQDNLAQLMLLYQSNPASLTLAQWQQLQAAGVIPGTVPYSSAGLVNPSSTSSPNAAGFGLATTPAAAPASASVLGTDASGNTTIFGLPWYAVVGGGALLLFVMSGRRGR